MKRRHLIVSTWVCSLMLLNPFAHAQEKSDSPAAVGLSASLFATDSAKPVNNVSLQWASTGASDGFEIQRAKTEAGPFEKIYSGTGKSFKDYDLADGTYFYRLVSNQSGMQIVSNTQRITTQKMPSDLQSFSNLKQNDHGLGIPGVKVGKTYYTFQFVREDKGLKHLMMRTTTDGKSWKDAGPVMDQSSHPDLADCKFEAENYFYDPSHDKIVLWGHWEKAQGYGSGKAVVASAKPGEKFTVHHIYNPLDVQVRDMSVFIDDDKQGYLVAASNVKGQGANATLYIFKLNETYDDAVEVVAKVVENGYREAPHIVKKDGYYYLYFSQAAGWYPSQGGYVSSQSIKGPWTQARTIGSPSTFSSQSGGILEFGSAEPHLPVMMGNRWIRGEGTSRNSVLPIQMASGFAFYDYYPALLHNASTNSLVPLDMGKLLSQDKKIESTIAGKPGREIEKAFDGDNFSSFQSDDKKWPFEVTADLESVSEIKNVQISWFLHKGSEGFYTYTISGSPDGKEWTTLLDRSNKADNIISKTYGFTSDVLPDGAKARYVKLKVNNAHLHNNPNNNWYSPTIYEIKIYGEPGNLSQ